MKNKPKWLQSSSHQSTAAIFLYSFAGIYLIAILILGQLAWRDPTSIFFRPDQAYAREYSNVRWKQSDAFLSNLTLNHIASSSATPSHALAPEICIGMPSVARKGARYLRTALASLLTGLTDIQRDRIYLIILLADLDPSQHPVYREGHITGLADRLLTYNLSDTAELEFINSLDDQHKGVYDYRYLLNACTETGAPYIALLEDDVLAMDGWFERTMSGLGQISNHGDRNWLYLRLFYTEIYLGWNSEHVGERIFWSLLVISVTAAVLLTVRIRSTHLRGYLTLPLMLAIICIAVPLSLVLFFLGGRLTLWPLPHGIHQMNEYGCCSQGLVFNGERVPAMLTWLDETPSGLFFDMFVEKYADNFHFQRWAIQPPVLQHVGVQSSSIGEKSEWAKRIWSFEFEQYDADKLSQERGLDLDLLR